MCIVTITNARRDDQSGAMWRLRKRDQTKIIARVNNVLFESKYLIRLEVAEEIANDGAEHSSVASYQSCFQLTFFSFCNNYSSRYAYFCLLSFYFELTVSPSLPVECGGSYFVPQVQRLLIRHAGIRPVARIDDEPRPNIIYPACLADTYSTLYKAYMLQKPNGRRIRRQKEVPTT